MVESRHTGGGESGYFLGKKGAGMEGIHVKEIVCGLATFVVLTSYHLVWYIQMRRAPFRTYQGVAKHLRRSWVESVIGGKRDILSVQTIRNWIMASSFLASTAIIIGLGLLSLLFRPEHMSEIPFDFTRIFSGVKILFKVKTMFLMLHFFFAFFFFTISIRYLNQVNFMINVPIECDPMLSSDFVANILDTGMLHYTLGLRAFYLSAVVALWLFGPIWMFLGSIGLVVVLYQLDHCCTMGYHAAQCGIGTSSAGEGRPQ
jgi:uncharacterized membrane protein